MQRRIDGVVESSSTKGTFALASSDSDSGGREILARSTGEADANHMTFAQPTARDAKIDGSPEGRIFGPALEDAGPSPERPPGNAAVLVSDSDKSYPDCPLPAEDLAQNNQSLPESPIDTYPTPPPPDNYDTEAWQTEYTEDILDADSRQVCNMGWASSHVRDGQDFSKDYGEMGGRGPESPTKTAPEHLLPTTAEALGRLKIRPAISSKKKFHHRVQSCVTCVYDSRRHRLVSCPTRRSLIACGGAS